jgi:hypothetical protein
MAGRSDRVGRRRVPLVGAHLLATSLICVALAAACDPYQRFGKNDDSLGPVDPASFPPANLGTRGDHTRAGGGAFLQIGAFAGGMPAAYFAYPVPASLADPLTVKGQPTPLAYAFAAGCQAPAGYAFDQRRDEVHLDRQDSVFSALPQATYPAGVAATSNYVPLVARALVTPAGQPCQKLKSEAAIKQAGLAAMPDGALLAWLIIDPAAGVFAPGKTPANDPGLGLQSWGWYNRYLLAYLDGGVVPVTDGKIVPQKLFRPRSMVTTTVTPPGGMAMTMAAPGRLGAGYDVLEARKGEPGYSPVCQVFTYDLGAPTDVAALPRDAAAIQAMYAPTLQPDSPPIIYCLQVP